MHEHGQNAHATFIPPCPGPTRRGCVIRFEPGTATAPGKPYLHINGSHQSVGVLPDSVKINSSGDLVFELDINLPVVGVSVSPDESLVMRGISGGLSGGGKECTVRFRQDGMGLNSKLWLTNAEHYAKIAGEYCNVWILIDSIWEGNA